MGVAGSGGQGEKSEGIWWTGEEWQLRDLVKWECDWRKEQRGRLWQAISHPSPAAPWSNRIPTGQSRAPPSKQVTPSRCDSVYHILFIIIIITLIEWNYFLLRKGNGFGQSIAPIVLVVQQCHKKSLFLWVCWAAVCGNRMYCGVNWTIPWTTLGSTRLTVDWDMPDLSAISLWKVPVARKLAGYSQDRGEYLPMRWSKIRLFCLWSKLRLQKDTQVLKNLPQ